MTVTSVAGTLVLTIEGSKPIEEIKAGDFVYSTNPETGESEYKEVARVFRRESDIIIHVFVNGEEIETTPNHPFWVEDQWVNAKDLSEGDVLTLADGTTAFITKTYGEQLDEPVIVYNFEVQDFHTYYVTDAGVLVHNANKYVTDDNGAEENKKTKWQYQKEWHDKRVNEIFNNPNKGKTFTDKEIGTRYYDASYKGYDIEYKSSNFNKGPRTDGELNHMQSQISKDIAYFEAGKANPHWHFEHNPRVANEMEPLLKQLEDAGIPWSFGSNIPF